MRVIQIGCTLGPPSSPSSCSKLNAASNSLSSHDRDFLSIVEFSFLNRASPGSSTPPISRVLKAYSLLKPLTLRPPHRLQWHPSLLSSMDAGLCLDILWSPSLSISFVVSLPLCSTYMNNEIKRSSPFVTLHRPIFLADPHPKGAINGSLLDSNAISLHVPSSFSTHSTSGEATPPHVGTRRCHVPASPMYVPSLPPCHQPILCRTVTSSVISPASREIYDSYQLKKIH